MFTKTTRFHYILYCDFWGWVFLAEFCALALKIQDVSLSLQGFFFSKAGTKFSLAEVHDQNAWSWKYEKENYVSICSAKVWCVWCFQVVVHKTALYFPLGKLLSECHYFAFHSFPFTSALNMINANGERPFFDLLLFLHYSEKIPNSMEMILYLLRAANETVLQFLPITS
jgi:hypothetical protein